MTHTHATEPYISPLADQAVLLVARGPVRGEGLDDELAGERGDELGGVLHQIGDGLLVGRLVRSPLRRSTFAPAPQIATPIVAMSGSISDQT